MIKRLKSKYLLAMAVFFILLCVHLIVSVTWHRPEAISTSQWGQNTIRSEKVLFSDISNSCVLVGSSMSARLDFSAHNKLGESVEILNLAYAGDSAATGLGLLLAAKKTPRCVLVETNLGYRTVDHSTVEELTNRIWTVLKQWFPPLRHENQPINQLLTFIKYLRDSKSTPPVDLSQQQPTQLSPKIERSDSLMSLIDNRLRGLTNITDEKLKAGVGELIRLSAQLQDKGVKVVLFEIPGEPEVRNSPYYSSLRSQLMQQLEAGSSGSSHAGQVIVDIGPVTTSDGIHLVGDSIEKVSREVVKLAEKALKI